MQNACLENQVWSEVQNKGSVVSVGKEWLNTSEWKLMDSLKCMFPGWANWNTLASALHSLFSKCHKQPETYTYFTDY